MNRRPAYLITIVLFAILLVAAYRYQQYIVDRAFLLKADTACDLAAHSCFASNCSPADDPACDPAPYEKVEVLAHDAPACLEEHTCDAFICEGRRDCAINYCTADAVQDGERCTTATSTGSP